MRTTSLLTFALIFALGAPPLPAQPSAGDPIPPRPKLEDYKNQSDFVRDVLAWQKSRDNRERYKQSRPDDTKSDDASPDDWHHVTGPEKLDEALRNAYGYIQPNYKEKYRFNRTTHLSFPLARLPARQLSDQSIDGALRTAAKEGEQWSLSPLPELQKILNETNEPLDIPDTAAFADIRLREDLGQIPSLTRRSEVNVR